MSTYLITGSNRGIGLEFCRQIHKRGDNVIATCRKASKELRDLGVRIEEDIEISSDESITNLCKKLYGVLCWSDADYGDITYYDIVENNLKNINGE